MRRLIRNVYSESPPVIMSPRLRPLRRAHIRIRFAIQRALRRPCTTPAYLHPEMDAEQTERLMEASETLMGALGGNPDQREAYRAKAMDKLIADPGVPDARKDLLSAARSELHPKPLVPEGSSIKTPAAQTPAAQTPDAVAVASNGSVPVAVPDEDLPKMPTRIKPASAGTA